jgi:hypothetical protein
MPVPLIMMDAVTSQQCTRIVDRIRLAGIRSCTASGEVTSHATQRCAGSTDCAGLVLDRDMIEPVGSPSNVRSSGTTDGLGARPRER